MKLSKLQLFLMFAKFQGLDFKIFEKKNGKPMFLSNVDDFVS